MRKKRCCFFLQKVMKTSLVQISFKTLYPKWCMSNWAGVRTLEKKITLFVSPESAEKSPVTSTDHSVPSSVPHSGFGTLDLVHLYAVGVLPLMPTYPIKLVRESRPLSAQHPSLIQRDMNVKPNWSWQGWMLLPHLRQHPVYIYMGQKKDMIKNNKIFIFYWITVKFTEIDTNVLFLMLEFLWIWHLDQKNNKKRGNIIRIRIIYTVNY